MFFSRFTQLGRAVGHAQRYRAIVGVFLKYGYDDVVRKLPLRGVWRWLPSRRFRQEQARLALLSKPVRLRLAFEELGPAFVKLGQLLASRTRLLPRPYVHELALLNDHVPPVPFAAVQGVLTEELKRPLNECFAAIDETPLAAASIAQVHRARLLDGSEVVVKIQRPAITARVRTDLEIMVQLAHLVDQHVEGWHVYQPVAVVTEFARRVELELDFTVEAASMARFARQFEGDPTVHVPAAHRALSGQRVLTMEYIQGIQISQLAELDAAGLDRAQIARRLSDLILRQIFVHGFFHGDPHPGNVHVLPGNVICYLDFGMTGFLTRPTREALADLLAAIAQRDEAAAARALLRLAGAELDPPRHGLEGDMAEFIHRNFGGPAGELVFARLLQHLFKLTAEHELTLPPEIFTVVKALGQTESSVRALDPELDFLALAAPYVRDLITNRRKPRRLMRDLVEFGHEAVAAAQSLPLDLRRIASQLQSGKSKVTFRVEGLRPLNDTLERVVNRLAFAVVLAALLVASALVIHAKISPAWHGIPVIGLIGYLAAGLMGLLLMVSMIRHGRM